jgi:hypothetical protein
MLENDSTLVRDSLKFMSMLFCKKFICGKVSTGKKIDSTRC